MTFSKASDSRIAGHNTYAFAHMGHKSGSHTQGVRRSRGSLTAGMSAANHHDIILHTLSPDICFFVMEQDMSTRKRFT
jgi:hypothetical protein